MTEIKEIRKKGNNGKVRKWGNWFKIVSRIWGLWDGVWNKEKARESMDARSCERVRVKSRHFGLCWIGVGLCVQCGIMVGRRNWSSGRHWWIGRESVVESYVLFRVWQFCVRSIETGSRWRWFLADDEWSAVCYVARGFSLYYTSNSLGRQ